MSLSQAIQPCGGHGQIQALAIEYSGIIFSSVLGGAVWDHFEVTFMVDLSSAEAASTACVVLDLGGASPLSTFLFVEDIVVTRSFPVQTFDTLAKKKEVMPTDATAFIGDVWGYTNAFKGMSYQGQARRYGRITSFSDQTQGGHHFQLEYLKNYLGCD